MATPPSDDPNRPKVIRTETVTTTPTPRPTVVVEDRSTTKAWIAGLSVLAIALVIGMLFMSQDKDESDTTRVSVNQPVSPAANPTVVETRVVTESVEPADVDIFVETTERDIAVLSRPDDAANQAEIAAIRQRMEDLRRADAAEVAAIRAELEASVTKLRAASTTSTTVTTSDSGVTAVTTTQPGTQTEVTTTGAGLDPATLDELNKRVADASALVGQLQSTAAPEAAQQVQELQTDLADVQEGMAKLSAATGQEQIDMVATVETDIASLEQAVKSVPVQ